MALSAKTNNPLIDALASTTAAAAVVSAVGARSTAALTTSQKNRIIAMCGSAKYGNEVIAALASGATLSAGACRAVVQGMAGDGAGAAGNELINFIQSSPRANKFNL